MKIRTFNSTDSSIPESAKLGLDYEYNGEGIIITGTNENFIHGLTGILSSLTEMPVGVMKEMTGEEEKGKAIEKTMKVMNGEFIIPDTIEGEPVIGIEKNAFSGETFKTVKIPETVTFIGESAFAGCANLIDINVPNDNITQIGDCAFKGCDSIAAVKKFKIQQINSKAFG